MSTLEGFIETEDGTVVLSLFGCADAANSDTLTKLVDQVIAEKPRLVVIDLRQLGFIASLGLGEFVRMSSAVRGHGGRVRLAGAQEWAEKVVKQSRLDVVVPMFPSIEAARQN